VSNSSLRFSEAKWCAGICARLAVLKSATNFMTKRTKVYE
jgi:hypothetical protein